MIAKDRDSNRRDLFEAIERGDYPRWLMQVQIMTEEEARRYRINPFDLTKVWYHKDFPLARRRNHGAEPQSGEFLCRD